MAVKVTVYSKEECHLCDELLAIVERVRKDRGFDLEVVDIRSDPELVAKYGLEIPVVMIDGRKAFKVRLTEADLKKKIDKAEARRARAASEEAAEEAASDAPVTPPKPVAAIVLLATLAGFAYFVAEGVSSAAKGREKLTAQLLKVDMRADDALPFRLTDLAGKEVQLSDFRDKTVFLNYWATWCPPCVEEMPSMRRLQKRLEGEKDLVFLAVSTDESWEPVRKFFGQDVPPFTVLLDPSGEVARRYGTTMFPETYIIRDGKVRAFIEGPRDWDEWYAEGFLRTMTKPD